MGHTPAAYLAEKLTCIYGGAFQRDPDVLRAFIHSLVTVDDQPIPPPKDPPP